MDDKQKKRYKEIKKAIDELYKNQFDMNMKEIVSLFEKDRKMIEEDFFLSIEKSIEIANKKNKEVRFLVIFYLRSSILTGSYDFLISLYDEKFYMDKDPIEVYYRPKYLMKYIDSDFEELKPQIGNKVIRPTKIEFERGKRYLVTLYYITFAKILILIRNDLVSLPAIEKINSNRDLQIYFGEYMGKLIPLFTGDDSKVDN